jgi:DNA-binding NarL/FixJ family response regulator
MTGHSVLSGLKDSQLADGGSKCKPRMINIILADHEAIFRAGAARVLAVEDDLRIVGQPQSSMHMLNALERLHAHVLLISNQFLPALLEKQRLPARHLTKVVVLAEHEDAAPTFVAMGAQGVVYRSIDGPSLVEAVRRVACGEIFIHSPNSAITEIHEDTVGARVVDRLSEIELGIIACVFRSCTNREIARQFGTNEPAVKNAMRAIFDKIGVSDRLELALFVLHHCMMEHAIQTVFVDNGLPSVFRGGSTPIAGAPAFLSLAGKATLSRENQRPSPQAGR